MNLMSQTSGWNRTCGTPHFAAQTNLITLQQYTAAAKLLCGTCIPSFNFFFFLNQHFKSCLCECCMDLYEQQAVGTGWLSHLCFMWMRQLALARGFQQSLASFDRLLYVFMPCDSETWREFLHKLLFSRFVSQWGDKGKPIFVNNKCIIMLKIFARVIKAMQDSWLCGQKNNAYDNKSSRKCIYSECICLEIPHSTNWLKIQISKTV